MPATSPPAITALPAPPDPANRSTFNTLAYPWSVAQQTLAPQQTAVASNMANNAQAAMAAAQAAEADAAAAAADKLAAAASAATAATQAAAATTANGTAGTQAAAATTAGTAATMAGNTAQAKATEATAAAQGIAALNARTSTAHPISRPALLLDFANTQRADPRITFTRTSTATRTNSRGLVEAVASGTPRIDFDPITLACKGLLVEESRTNLVTYNETPAAHLFWGIGSYVVEPYTKETAAPNGAHVASKLTAIVTGFNGMWKPAAISVSTVYTVSAYFKKGTSAKWLLGLSDNVDSGCNVFFDANNPTAAAGGGPSGGWSAFTSGVQDVGNGWWRCWFTTTSNSSDTATNIYACPTNTNINSTTAGDSCFVYGTQLEAGAFPTSYIPSAVTHTGRSSTATFIGSNGLIQTAASGAARYSYNPLNLSAAPALLLEETRTNLLTYSSELDNPVWGKQSGATITANTATAPDGTLTADTLTGNGSGSYVDHTALSLTNGQKYAASFYAKAGTVSTVAAVFYGANFNAGGANINPQFDLASGVVVSAGGAENAQIQSVGNGWYRCSFVVTLTAATGPYINQLIRTPAAAGTLFVWGAQIEVGSYPTSYIPTTASQVTRSADTSTSATTTRAADVPTMTGSNFSSWYRPDEGTFTGVTEQAHTQDLNIMYVTRGLGSWGPRLQLSNSRNPTLNNVNDALAVDCTIGTATSRNPHAWAFAYKTNDYAMAAGGVLATPDAAVSVPTGLADLRIGMNPVGAGQLNGHIRRIAYYPQRLTNAQLQLITAQ